MAPLILFILVNIHSVALSYLNNLLCDDSVEWDDVSGIWNHNTSACQLIATTANNNEIYTAINVSSIYSNPAYYPLNWTVTIHPPLMCIFSPFMYTSGSSYYGTFTTVQAGVTLSLTQECLSPTDTTWREYLDGWSMGEFNAEGNQPQFKCSDVKTLVIGSSLNTINAIYAHFTGFGNISHVQLTSTPTSRTPSYGTTKLPAYMSTIHPSLISSINPSKLPTMDPLTISIKYPSIIPTANPSIFNPSSITDSTVTPTYGEMERTQLLTTLTTDFVTDSQPRTHKNHHILYIIIGIVLVVIVVMIIIYKYWKMNSKFHKTLMTTPTVGLTKIRSKSISVEVELVESYNKKVAAILDDDQVNMKEGDVVVNVNSINGTTSISLFVDPKNEESSDDALYEDHGQTNAKTNGGIDHDEGPNKRTDMNPSLIKTPTDIGQV